MLELRLSALLAQGWQAIWHRAFFGWQAGESGAGGELDIWLMPKKIRCQLMADGPPHPRFRQRLAR